MSPTWSDHEADPSERDLVARIRAGEERALEALHIKYWHSLVRAAVRYVGDEELARDVVQDVFSDIWYRRESWAPQGTVAGYLYGAIRNRAISVARHEQWTTRWPGPVGTGARDEDSEREGSSAPYPVVDASQAEQLEVAELDALLRARLRSLPERCRETYLLYRGGDLTVAEVAHVMGVSTETAKTQIKRAMAALRDVVTAYHDR